MPVRDVNKFISENINPLIGTLKPQSNGPLYSNRLRLIGTLAVDGWYVTARRSLGGAASRYNYLYTVKG